MNAFAPNVVVGSTEEIEFLPEEVEKAGRHLRLRRLGAPYDYPKVHPMLDGRPREPLPTGHGAT